MNIPEKLSFENKLELYALNKQATNGEINIDKPIMFNVVADAKYLAWSSKKGITKEDAHKKYIEFVNRLF